MTSYIQPGPWSVVDDVPNAHIGYRAIVDAEGYTICEPSPMGEDTARLIASAPALLAALNAILDDVDADRAQGYEPPDWYGLARAAVAMTAEG